MEDKNQKLPSTRIQWYPGHMAKTRKQIIEDLKLIDVVIELLDARIPLSSRNPDIEDITKSKKRIIALNKSDLADSRENKKWIEYFEKNEIPAVITDSNSGNGIKDILKEVEKIMEKDIKKQIEKGRVGRTIRILVLGIPNVGKSSFINRISKKTSLEVGNKPGVTRKKQWIRVSDKIELLDTPGVLWPKFQSEEVALNLAYTGTIKDEILDKVEVAFFLLKFLLNNYRENLIQRYNLDKEDIEYILNKPQAENENVLEIMYLIGKKRGAIVSGGKVDEEKVSNLILDDFRTCKLGKITIEKVGNK